MTSLPLIRKYFRQGNNRLRQLLIAVIENAPTDRDSISDLAFFHEFNDIFDDLLRVYLKACLEIEDLQKFELLARDFFHDTFSDDFNALYELKEIFGNTSEKGIIVNNLIEEQAKNSLEEDIEF